jgi:hypothetical protein
MKISDPMGSLVLSKCNDALTVKNLLCVVERYSTCTDTNSYYSYSSRHYKHYQHL